jgi:hypothetical protein
MLVAGLLLVLLLGLLFCPEERGYMFLRNVSGLVQNYKALQPRRFYSS